MEYSVSYILNALKEAQADSSLSTSLVSICYLSNI